MKIKSALFALSILTLASGATFAQETQSMRIATDPMTSQQGRPHSGPAGVGEFGKMGEAGGPNREGGPQQARKGPRERGEGLEGAERAKFEEALRVCRNANPDIQPDRGDNKTRRVVPDRGAHFAFEGCMSGKGFPKPGSEDDNRPNPRGRIGNWPSGTSTK